MGITKFPNGVSSFGNVLYGDGSLDTSGTTYYVDNNSGADTNDGFSWETAKKTLASALATSHADIARGSDRWARRNRIFIAGDRIVESLTKGAQKTDIIGVGSCDHKPSAVIRGAHVFDTTSYMGMRFINVGFENSAAGIMIDLPTAQSGIQFIGCTFDGEYDDATIATTAIRAAAGMFMAIKDCRFVGKFSTATISLIAGDANGLLIENNIIESGAKGLLVAASVTCATKIGVVRGNFFNTVTHVIDDGSDVFAYVGNRGVTAATSGANTHSIAAAEVVDNIFTSSNGTLAVPACNFGAQS